MTPKKAASGAKKKGGEVVPRGQNRVLFLKHKEEIAKLNEEGYTLRSIWEQVFPKQGISYSQFGRYVARFIREDSNDRTRKATVTPPPVSQPAKPASGAGGSSPAQEGVIGTFQYDPTHKLDIK